MNGHQWQQISTSPEFSEATGPISVVPEDEAALDFFFLMFPEELFKLLVEETNR